MGICRSSSRPRAWESSTHLRVMAVSYTHLKALETVLPRICEPILAPAEIVNMDPADLMSVGATVASFFLSKADKSAFQTS